MQWRPKAASGKKRSSSRSRSRQPKREPAPLPPTIPESEANPEPTREPGSSHSTSGRSTARSSSRRGSGTTSSPRKTREKTQPEQEAGKRTGRRQEDNATRSKKASRKTRKPKRVSRLQKPGDMSLEDWQIELRRQFGREQNFALKNVGDHTFFSSFDVTNPESKNTYRVRIRGTGLGDNFCSCPDFTTNTLGTCKHIEFTLASLERKRGGKKALREGFQQPFSEVYLQYGAQREVRFRPGSECPTPVARLASNYFDAEGALLPEAFGKFETFLGQAEKHDHDLRFHEDVLAFIAEVRDAEQRRKRVKEAFPKGIKSAAFKELLKVPLYDYQREGVLFAAKAGRCLIGDDMGLGKTVQALAIGEVMSRLFGVERILVVCPTSLKHQWHREIERFTHRTGQVIGGQRHRRAAQFAEESFYKITNYDTVHADLEAIHTWSPDLVILDEAQRIKNWATRTARSVKKIAAPYAVVLTGTPLENRLEELISIVQFVDLYRLGPTFRILHDHQIRDDVGKVVGYRDLDKINKTLEPILVRRHKHQVLDQLPERIDNTFYVSMTNQQQLQHTENLEIVARIVHKWRRYRFLSEADQRRLMIALQRMRMSCDSTFLVDHHTDHGNKADEAITLLEEIFEEQDTKVVIFSQWKRMHELLVRRFEGRPWDHVLFHGGVPSGKRKGLIDQFRDDPNCRVFLSTDTGGTGLNLQHASVVMNMDLPWNPAVLEQRIGRVHRLGQQQSVRVINFVAQGTIEEGMQNVLQFKKSLFTGVLDGGDSEVFMGGSRFQKFMETVESATSAIPESMLEDAEDALRAPPDEQIPDFTPGPEQPAPPAFPTLAGIVSESGGAPASGAGTAPSRAGQQPTPTQPSTPAPPAAPSLPAPADPWAGLLQNGLALLQQLAGAQGAQPSGNGSRPASTPGSGAGSMVQRDEQTGETYLRVPVPPPEVLNQAVQAFGQLLQSFTAPPSNQQ